MYKRFLPYVVSVSITVGAYALLMLSASHVIYGGK